MQAATQQLTNSSKLKDVRRGIARVRTLMHGKSKAQAWLSNVRVPGSRSSRTIAATG